MIGEMGVRCLVGPTITGRGRQARRSVAPPASPTGTDVDHRTSQQAQQDDRTVRGSDTIRLRIAELQKELDKALEAEGKTDLPSKETAARD